MSDRVIDWIRDLSQYGHLLWQRTVASRLDGVDYSDERYRDVQQRIVERLHPRRMLLEVVEVVEESASTRTFRMARLDGPLPPHRPGQYINLFVDLGAVRSSRPYSISSPPGSDTLDITVRLFREGFVSPWLFDEVAVGDVFRSTGPQGEFYYEPLIHGRDLVMIAGGSGITPFMSMLADQRRRGASEPRTHLIYGCRDRHDVIFERALDRLAEAMPSFSWSLVVSEPSADDQGLRGLIDAALLRQVVGEVEGKSFFICGPHGMHALIDGALDEIGVPCHRRTFEHHGPPSDITTAPGWPEGLTSSEIFTVDVEGIKTIEACAGEPLMASLERNGIVIPARCRVGHCSACNTRVLNGEVFLPPSAGLRQAARCNRTVHACVTYPVDDLTIRVSTEREDSHHQRRLVTGG